MEMDVTVKTKALKEALKQANKLIKTNKNIPVLSSAKIEAKEGKLTIKTQDEISRFSISIDAEVNEGTEVLVDPKMMLSIVESFEDDDMFITKEEGKPLNLQAGWAMTALAVKTTEGYPDFNNEETENIIEMETKTLKEMITRTSFACSVEQNRPLFTGVYVKITDGAVTMAGTDTHFMAVARYKTDEAKGEKELVIPKKFMDDIVTNNITDDKVTIGIYGNMVVFAYDNARYMVRTIEGKFPDIYRVIPKETVINVKVAREKLEKSITRSMIFDKTKKTTIMYFKVNEKEIMLNSQDETGSINDKVLMQQAEGEDIKIAFNMEYLSKVLRWKEEYINIGMNKCLSPAVFKKSGADEENKIQYTYVVTPLRMDETTKFEQEKEALKEAEQTEQAQETKEAAHDEAA